VGFTERDAEIIKLIADGFRTKEPIISKEWLVTKGISEREYLSLAKTIGVSLRSYALLPSDIRKKLLDVAVLDIAGQPMNIDHIRGSFQSISQALKKFPNCRIANCKCNSKEGEWKKGCLCLCHMDQAQEILGKDFDLSDLQKLAGSDKRD